MKLKKVLCFGLSIMMASVVFAATSVNKEQEKKSLFEKSKKDFVVCDVTKLVAAFQTTDKNHPSPFNVDYMADKDANYNYYMVTERNGLNADKIRKITCQFVMANKCYLFWGNVANMAAISAQKAAWFPLDTSAHYMYSPYVTCNKLAKKAELTKTKTGE